MIIIYTYNVICYNITKMADSMKKKIYFLLYNIFISMSYSLFANASPAIKSTENRNNEVLEVYSNTFAYSARENGDPRFCSDTRRSTR